MKAVTLRKPPGIDSLDLVEREDPGAPGAGEIRVRVHASSLNYHDLAVVMGKLPPNLWSVIQWSPVSFRAG
jgi:NADPH:quinone reductase-like Zn-dependent oxidoreductase